VHTGDPQPLEPVPGVRSVRHPSLQGPGEKSVTAVHHLSSPVQIYGHTAAGNRPGLSKHKRETRGWNYKFLSFLPFPSNIKKKKHPHTTKTL